MGEMWAKCKFCGYTAWASYDPRWDDYDELRMRLRRQVQAHVFEKHKDQLPEQVRSDFNAYMRWDEEMK